MIGIELKLLIIYRSKCIKIKYYGNSSLYYIKILSLLGHNGAGKTTTINVLIGLLSSSGGEV